MKSCKFHYYVTFKAYDPDAVNEGATEGWRIISTNSATFHAFSAMRYIQRKLLVQTGAAYKVFVMSFYEVDKTVYDDMDNKGKRFHTINDKVWDAKIKEPKEKKDVKPGRKNSGQKKALPKGKAVSKLQKRKARKA